MVEPADAVFSDKQGRYLAFLYWYTKLNGRPPAEADFEGYLKDSPSAVHQTILSLEKKGLLQRTPGQARSLHLLLKPEEIPDLETGKQVHTIRSPAETSAYPGIAGWIKEHGGWIEIGYDYNTNTFARALDEGGMIWGGGHRRMFLEDALRALDSAIIEWEDEQS